MKFRIVKETYYTSDGKKVTNFYPQKKGWFFWNYFYYYDGTCPMEHRFNSLEEAETFIDAEVKNRTTCKTVVKEISVNG